MFARKAWALLSVLAIGLGVNRAPAADRAAEIVAIHLEAIGGRERIDALHAMRATGEVMAGGKKMRFTLIAARPNLLRLETDEGGRSLVQATDGRNPPWQFDTGEWPPRYRDIPATVARTFAEDAEFDDPLVGGAKRGFTIEYAGETKIEDKPCVRLLVTRALTETFSLLLDSDTFLILQRVEDRKSPLGGTVHIVTVFENYLPVEGVLVPHVVTLFIDGRPKQQTHIESVQPNPEISAETFERPVAVSVPKVEKD
jgi:hypothetical protein